MKIIYNKFIPLRAYCAINLFGVIFARKEFKPLSQQEIFHERIHTAQIKELFFIFFYIWYLLEFLFRLFQYHTPGKAYENISFEREAYTNDTQQDYLKRRKSFSFVRYLKL